MATQPLIVMDPQPSAAGTAEGVLATGVSESSPRAAITVVQSGLTWYHYRKKGKVPL